MPETWMKSLQKYSYPVNLSEYQPFSEYPMHFKKVISGDRASTIEFENYFRLHSHEIEPWFEVVFWKLYSQKKIAVQTTKVIIRNMTANGIVDPITLTEKAKKFMQSESERDFENFRRSFNFSTTAIATIATFPAFLDPNNYPMVDTRVAKWVNSELASHNRVDTTGPQLIRSNFDGNFSYTTLHMNDFPFYLHWIRWTRHMAKKLSAATNFPWRARDVEMAVFTAWGNKGCSHPALRLNPITADINSRV
ncbi:MAG: hypothetical protein WCP36_09350 [Methanomicrobiales archaeon]